MDISKSGNIKWSGIEEIVGTLPTTVHIKVLMHVNNVQACLGPLLMSGGVWELIM